MDLLGFARGPALKVALAVFCLGVVWRIVGFALRAISVSQQQLRLHQLGLVYNQLFQ